MTTARNNPNPTVAPGYELKPGASWDAYCTLWQQRYEAVEAAADDKTEETWRPIWDMGERLAQMTQAQKPLGRHTEKAVQRLVSGR